jgi:hypothetical protein
MPDYRLTFNGDMVGRLNVTDSFAQALAGTMLSGGRFELSAAFEKDANSPRLVEFVLSPMPPPEPPEGGDIMGITLDDLNAQRAMLARGEEKRKAAKQAEERERLRDTFAAAALTGMMSRVAGKAESFAEAAYKLADAMLRERGQFDRSQPIRPADDTLTTHTTPNEGSVQNGCTLTDAEREAIECAVLGDDSFHAAALRGLLERMK